MVQAKQREDPIINIEKGKITIKLADDEKDKVLTRPALNSIYGWLRFENVDEVRYFLKTKYGITDRHDQDIIIKQIKRNLKRRIQATVPTKAIGMEVRQLADSSLLPTGIKERYLSENPFLLKNTDGSYTLYFMGDGAKIFRYDVSAENAKFMFNAIKKAKDAAKASREMVKMLPETIGEHTVDRDMVALAFSWAYSEQVHDKDQTLFEIKIAKYGGRGMFEAKIRKTRDENVEKRMKEVQELTARLDRLNSKINRILEDYGVKAGESTAELSIKIGEDIESLKGKIAAAEVEKLKGEVREFENVVYALDLIAFMEHTTELTGNKYNKDDLVKVEGILTKYSRNISDPEIKGVIAKELIKLKEWLANSR